jgi:16S rRNA pseudouridine516 synthase
MACRLALLKHAYLCCKALPANSRPEYFVSLMPSVSSAVKPGTDRQDRRILCGVIKCGHILFLQFIMRLDKFLADTTDLTRSLATKAVKSGRVLVNGVKPKSASAKVADSDEITLDGERLILQTGHRYILLHKPAGYVCANRGSAHPLVFDLLKGITNRLDMHTVGRLDLDTTGLLLITDDGQWSHHLTSPRHHQPKVYRAWLAEDLCADAEQRCERGILLDDDPVPTKPAQLQRISDREVLLTIHEGRYHQVRRMFAAMGNHVEHLHREQVGEFVLDPDLPVGEFRDLTEAEIALLAGG